MLKVTTCANESAPASCNATSALYVGSGDEPVGSPSTNGRAAVGANFFKPQQAEEKRCVAVGRGGTNSQVLEANGEFAVAVTDFNETVRLGTARRAVPSRSLAPKPLKYRKDWFGACNTSKQSDGKIHVFSVASGQTYERLLRIMIASVALASSRPVKVWLLEVNSSPAIAAALAADFAADVAAVAVDAYLDGADPATTGFVRV